MNAEQRRAVVRAASSADFEIEQEYRISYDFHKMEYVDPDGIVVPGEQIKTLRLERMTAILGYPVDHDYLPVKRDG